MGVDRVRDKVHRAVRKHGLEVADVRRSEALLAYGVILIGALLSEIWKRRTASPLSSSGVGLHSRGANRILIEAGRESLIIVFHVLTHGEHVHAFFTNHERVG